MHGAGVSERLSAKRKPKTKPDRLRMITEFFPEEVDSVYVVGGRIDVDTHTDIGMRIEGDRIIHGCAESSTGTED